MKVLVTGAGGFIGAAVVEALSRHGHEVASLAREALDLRAACSPQAWLAHLEGVTAVVNCAGILRESSHGDFDRIHHDAPLALAEACRLRGVAKFVQVSALGDEAGGAFIASKHRFDAALLALGIPATVIRPSVVLSARGSRGGTSLLRAMAALPFVVFLPGAGQQRLQPVMREDLAQIVTRCVRPEVAAGQVLHAVGPEVLTLRRYLAHVREWLGLPPAQALAVPMPLVRLASWFGEILGAGPLGRTIAAMLERGNVGPPGAWEQVREATGIVPQAIGAALRESPSLVQDRWHARLYLLRPVAVALLAITWIASGLVGLAAPPADFAPYAARLGVPEALQPVLVRAAGGLDLALGLALPWRRLEAPALAMMAASVVAYTVLIGGSSPEAWREPMGGLLKNGALLALLAFAGATRGRA